MRLDKGFTLIEVVLAILLSGIIITNSIKLFSFIGLSISEIGVKNGSLNKLNRAMDYVTGEIKRSNEISKLNEHIGKEKFNKRYPDNIGLLFTIYEKDVNLFITYCIDGDKLKRMSYRLEKNQPINLELLEGYNTIVTGVSGLNKTIYDSELSYIEIKLNENKNKESQVTRIVNIVGEI